MFAFYFRAMPSFRKSVEKFCCAGITDEMIAKRPHNNNFSSPLSTLKTLDWREKRRIHPSEWKSPDCMNVRTETKSWGWKGLSLKARLLICSMWKESPNAQHGNEIQFRRSEKWTINWKDSIETLLLLLLCFVFFLENIWHAQAVE